MIEGIAWKFCQGALVSKIVRYAFSSYFNSIVLDLVTIVEKCSPRHLPIIAPIIFSTRVKKTLLSALPCESCPFSPQPQLRIESDYNIVRDGHWTCCKTSPVCITKLAHSATMISPAGHTLISPQQYQPWWCDMKTPFPTDLVYHTPRINVSRASERATTWPCPHAAWRYFVNFLGSTTEANGDESAEKLPVWSVQV